MGDLLNNFSKGAKCIKEKLNEDVIELAIKSLDYSILIFVV